MVGAGMTPFAEHFALGIKDLIPMAYSDCVSHVDKGIDKSEIEAAWFGELSTTDGFPSGILADTLDLTDIPVTRVENACATGNDAIRNGTLAIASGLSMWYSWWVRTRCARRPRTQRSGNGRA